MNFSERVTTFLKSLSGTETEEKGKKKTAAEQGEEVSAEPENGDVTLEDSHENDEGSMAKSGDVADATEILNALVGELKEISTSLASLIKKQDGMEKSQADFGEAVVGVAQMVAQIAKTPVPVKGVMSKGALGGGTAPVNGRERLTHSEFELAQVALTKSCAAGRLSIHQCSRLESEMQKAMNMTGYQMKDADIATIAREMKTA